MTRYAFQLLFAILLSVQRAGYSVKPFDPAPFDYAHDKQGKRRAYCGLRLPRRFAPRNDPVLT